MGWKAAGGPQSKPPPRGGFGGRRPPGSASGRTALRAGSSLLRKFWSRESAGFPARQGAGEGRCRGAGKTGPGRCIGKKQREMASLQFAGDGAPAGGGAPEGLRLRRSRRLCRRGRPADGLPFGRPGRAEIQRKYRVTSAPGPADGRWLHGFAAPVRGKCGCGGWPQQNPPGVRQIQAHPRRQSAPARPR